MNERKLLVIPSNLSSEFAARSFSKDYQHEIFSLKHFVVENERSARRFLRQLGYPGPISELHFRTLNEHTTADELNDLLNFIAQQDTGLLSEAGCPGVADPGADLIALAHSRCIQVIPLIGPSSILLALMASGLNGQRFSFNGYLGRDKNRRKRQLQQFEKESAKENRTQIFIEAPYRNKALFNAVCSTLHPGTVLTLACELTSKKEWIKTKTIRDWRKCEPDIHKKNTVFLFLSRGFKN